VLVPTLYLCDDETAQSVQRAFDAGAHVLVTFFSGIVDERDHIRPGAYPGAFRDLLGIATEEFYPMLAEQSAALDDALAAGSQGTQWSELLTCTDAEVVTRFVDGPLPGAPAVTRRQAGGAAAWYVATRLDETGADALIQRFAGEAGVRPPAEAPAGVEVVRRRGPGGSWLFVLNHTPAEVVVAVAGWDLVADQAIGPLRLAAGGSAVVRES
jgi:beta-galactosidase